MWSSEDKLSLLSFNSQVLTLNAMTTVSTNPPHFTQILRSSKIIYLTRNAKATRMMPKQEKSACCFKWLESKSKWRTFAICRLLLELRKRQSVLCIVISLFSQKSPLYLLYLTRTLIFPLSRQRKRMDERGSRKEWAMGNHFRACPLVKV